MKEIWKVAVSEPFLRRKSLHYLSKNGSLWQRNERQDGCFLERDTRKKATAEGPDLCGPPSAFSSIFYYIYFRIDHKAPKFESQSSSLEVYVCFGVLGYKA